MGVFAILVPLVLLVALPDVHSSNKTASISIRLIHKYSPESPFYPGNITFLERMKMMSRDSEARVSYLNSIHEQNSTLNFITPYVSSQGSIYVAEARVGEPGKYFYFLLDTGSDLSWVLCKEDRGFHFTDPGYYNPYKSNTHRDIQCDDPACDGSCKQGKCGYGIAYHDGSRVRGYVVRDSFWFKAPREQGIKGVLFVCADPEKTKITQLKSLKGLLGMSPHPKSFTSQLSEYIDGRFSYCFVPPKESGLTPMSYLKFGMDMGYLSPSVQMTKFLKPDKHFPAYLLDIVDISVEGERLDYPPGAFRNTSDSGVAIDSGSGLTHLHANVYWKLHNALTRYFDRYKLVKRQSCIFGIPGKSGIQLCYELPKYFTSFPSMTYHFKEGGKLKIAPEQTFIIDRGDWTFDLAIMLDHSRNILGSYQQQNTRFTYDNRVNALYFVPENCARDPS
ncbi:hypothetical protein ACFE04_006603 [Oxalis oulophora]